MEDKKAKFLKDLEVLDHKIPLALNPQVILNNYRILSCRVNILLMYLLFHQRVNFQAILRIDNKIHKSKDYLHLIFLRQVQYKIKDNHLASSQVKLHNVNVICFNLHLVILKRCDKALPSNSETLIHDNLTLNSIVNRE